MNANTLTGALALEAREYIGLSIMSVAKITGINRNALSQFEQEKAVLPSSEKKALANFYLDRGYDFNSEKEIDHTVEHEELKEETVEKIRFKFGDELAESLLTIYADAKERIKSLEGKVYDQQEEIYKKNYVSDSYAELETAIIKHLLNDKNGNVKVDFGFFGNEDRSEREDRMISLFALQYLRILSKKRSDVLTLAKVSPEGRVHSDLNMLLDGLENRLGFDALGEFSGFDSSTIYA